MGRSVDCGTKTIPLLPLISNLLDTGVVGRELSWFDVVLGTKLKVDEEDAVESRESTRRRSGIIIGDSVSPFFRDNTTVLVGEEYLNGCVEEPLAILTSRRTIAKGKMEVSWR